MSRLPDDRQASAHPYATQGPPRTRHAPYLPLPTDVPMNPDEPVSKQAAQLLHEFVHPHHHYSQENLLETEGEPDDTGSDTSVIEELKGMRSRVWWRRPSALWFLCAIPFVLSASASTVAPKVQVVTRLVCKTLRPEYTDRSGVDNSFIFFAAVDDEETRLCNADPEVQAASAEFLTLIAAATGVLSCLTTAYWGSRSDRTGRISTLKICMFGNLFTDLTYLFVYSFLRDRNGAYWFLLIAPFIEGSLGGLNAASANIHAYMSDCTDPARRSRVFSIYLGLIYTGMAIGPALGSLLIRQTGNLLPVFYYAFATHLTFASMVWFVVPESLAPTQISKAKATYNENKVQTRGGLGGLFANLLSFLTPLKLFAPITVATAGNPLKRRKDWNLTLLAAAYGLSNMWIGSHSFKFQYATKTFGWSTELLGYWMSVSSFTRAITLAFVLPVVISLFKRLSSPTRPSTRPTPTTPPSPGSEDPQVLRNAPEQQATYAVPGSLTSSHSTTTTRRNVTSDTRPSAQSNPTRTTIPMAEKKDSSSPRLDLNTARASLLVEVTSYILMATAKTGAMFTAYTILSSLAAGYAPAVQSLALGIYAGRGGEETGKLFGGLNVVHALGGSILSPILFGFTYSMTVATFPQAMFIVGASAFALALLCMLAVRLPKDGADGVIVVTEDGAVNDEEMERLVSGDGE